MLGYERAVDLPFRVHTGKRRYGQVESGVRWLTDLQDIVDGFSERT